jgi:hypothetical protein
MIASGGRRVNWGIPQNNLGFFSMRAALQGRSFACTVHGLVVRNDPHATFPRLCPDLSEMIAAQDSS